MFFQPIVLDRNGFQIKVIRGKHYPLHWHSDLEILYCTKGSFTVENEETRYCLETGDLILLGSCEPHSLTVHENAEGYIVSLGFHFFGDEFERIRNMRFDPPVIRQNEAACRQIDNVVSLQKKRVRNPSDNMEMRGNMYTLASILLNSLPVAKEVTDRQQERLYAVSKIQKALDYVAENYAFNVTVEQAAEVSGYEKSSFCRSFKNATNSTFHKYLNTYRVSKAKIMLTETNESISFISYRVGFTQHKNFCRLFKEIYGLSPSEYRKKYR